MAEWQIGENIRFDISHDRLHCFDLDGSRIQA